VLLPACLARSRKEGEREGGRKGGMKEGRKEGKKNYTGLRGEQARL
jgi:hypothetical protein